MPFWRRLTGVILGVEVKFLRSAGNNPFARSMFHELVMIHEDPDFHDIGIAIIPYSKNAEGEIEKFCKKINLPRILKEEGEINLAYPL